MNAESARIARCCWAQLHRLVDLSQRCIVLLSRKQRGPIPVVSLRFVRGKLQCSLELLVRTGYVPISIEERERLGAMASGEIGVKLNRSRRGSLSPLK